MNILPSKFIGVIGACALVFSTGCKNFIGSPDLPAGAQDINSVLNRDGALNLYNTVVATFGHTIATTSLSVGLFTDELRASALIGNTDFLAASTAFFSGSESNPLQGDARRLSERDISKLLGNDVVAGINWRLLHTLRMNAMQGIGIFAGYTTEPAPLRGHLYAILGFAELQLADVYCSGIPLSTVDFKKDWTYHAGSTTLDVYQHAVALFDTALALSADSARILNLARVGKGRALLALGQYTAAAAAVSEVPDDYRYEQTVTWKRTNGLTAQTTISDREGGVGLPYLSDRDRRIDSVFVGTNRYGVRLHLPRKYPINVASTFVLANGIEAQLIIAEAKLHEEKTEEWLAVMNHLRQTAIIPALSTLQDPGTLSARIDTLFKERAFWLYLTGHRLGDIRRLVRQYGREPNTVYPTGGYPGLGGNYGNDVVLPIDAVNEVANPYFQGCLSDDA